MGDVLAVVGSVFGSLTLLIILAAWGSRTQNWQKQIGSRRMVLRMPPLTRFVFGGIGLWLVLTPLWLMVRNIRDREGLALFLVFELMACAMGSLFLWGAGSRREIVLDTERRHYRFTTGWGPWTHIRAGGLEDFCGVFVRIVDAKNGEIYTVGLAWKRGEFVCPTLGNFRAQPQARLKADALASEMSAALGLPLVPAPPPETVKIRFRRVSAISR